MSWGTKTTIKNFREIFRCSTTQYADYSYGPLLAMQTVTAAATPAAIATATDFRISKE